MAVELFLGEAIWGTCELPKFKIFGFLKRTTELLPGLIFAKINFFIIRDMVKSLEYDVFTIIISNFD